MQNLRFSRGIIGDWYDGPVSGVVECGPEGKLYAFRMAAWDEGAGERFYVLEALPPGVLDDLVRATRGAGEPTWPWWSSPHFSSEAEREEAWTALERTLAMRGPPEFVVRARDLTGSLGQVWDLRGDPLQSRVRALLATEGTAEDEFVCSAAPFAEWARILGSGST